MVTQEDLDRATAREPKATQNATQHTAATGGTGSQSKVLERKESLDLPGDTRRCDPMQHQSVGDTGFELSPTSSGNDALAVEGNVKCNALADDSSAIDADLPLIIDAWAELPRSVQARILALVKAEVGNV